MSTSVEDRALKLLSLNVPPGQVASILGVTPGYISQLEKDSNFSARLTEEKFKTLTAQTQRDAEYDSLEDKVLDRLKHTIPLMHRPMELVRTLQVLNTAKRRGTVAENSDLTKKEVIQLVLPVAISQKFMVQFNSVNQAVAVDSQDLVTIPASKLQELVNNEPISNQSAAGPTPALIGTKQTDGR